MDPPCGYPVEAENAGKNRAFAFGKKARSRYDPKTYKKYPVNRITTSKYTVFSFLPKSIYGQFRRLANFYFLFMSIIMMLGEYTSLFDSPISWTTTFLSLIIIMCFTMVMQIKDDVQRHMQDAEVDARDAESSRLGKQQWKDVQIGDVIVVRNQEFFPADVVLLTSSSKAGSCYIETSNIDGETNLKIRSSVPKISNWLQAGKLGDLGAAAGRCNDLEGVCEYQLPNSSVNAFDGIFTELSGGAGAPKFNRSDLVLNDKQQLLRGSCLRNTKWILGLVVYTGEESKVAMNSQETPEKLSNLENVVNKSMKVILLVLFVLVLITDIAAAIFRSKEFTDYEDENGSRTKFWYLFPNGKDEDDWYDLPHFLAMLFTYTILYNNMVPLSMYVTMELINMYHAQFINNDKTMFDPETKTAARARTMNLCSELGQIQYIFSDKTGTLTANIMEFKRCSIGGHMFGTLDTKHFESKNMFNTLQKGPSDPVCADIEAFMTVMGVGHTVVAEPDKTNEHGVHYEAESPDEGALVEGAAKCGFRFVNRSPDTITIRYEGDSSPCRGNGGKKTERTFKLLAINAFNSTRKRSSMLVETPDGKILLLCKGADNIMLARADPTWDNRTIKNHLTEFSKEGLRTLVMGTREITPAQRDAWLKKYREASGSTVDRKKKMMAVAEEIEKDMTIVGASAIEDKLQDGVPDCIADVRQAGVKLWVLTGDKMETAINIGYSCKLLDAEPGKMKILKMKVDEDLSTLHNIEECEETLRALYGQISKVQGHNILGIDGDDDVDPAMRLNQKDLRNLALVITGPTLGCVYEPIYPWQYKGPKKKKKKKLGHDDNGASKTTASKSADENDSMKNHGALDKAKLTEEEIAEHEKVAQARCERMKKYLLEIGKVCKVVVACRVSPLQKAQTVKLVKEGLEVTPVTLAIGDGANDVSMIKEAHVGVGISGREGLQAANSADFSIAQFRFLRQLLFVHGRYDYRRMSKVILFSFYKNVVLVLTLFYFNFFNGFSGQPLYDDWLYSGFNLFLFASPVLLGLLDMDVEKETVFEVPQLYMSGRLQLDLNSHKMIENILLSILNSIVVMLFSALSYPTLDDGVNNGVYLFGTLVFSNLFFSMQYRCMFIGHTWTKHTVYGLLFSIFLLFLFFLLYGGVICLYMGDPATFYYYVPIHLMGQPMYWITVMSTICICASFDLIAEYLRVEFSPNLIDLCVEIEMTERREDRKRNGIRHLVSGRLREFASGFLSKVSLHGNATNNGRVASSPSPLETKEPPMLPPVPRLSPRKLKTQKSILTLHTAEKGHESDEEHDSAYPENAHTGPLYMAHLATHTTDVDVLDVDLVDAAATSTKSSEGDDGDSKTNVESMAIDVRKDSSAGDVSASNSIMCCQFKDGAPAPDFIDTPFYQQTSMKAQIFVTARGALIAHFVIGALLMIFGGVIYDASEGVIYLDNSYAGRRSSEEGDFSRGKAFYAHTNCTNTLQNSFDSSLYGGAGWWDVANGVQCNVTFRVPHKMEAPVTVFYRLTDFYQNYNSYFSSRDSLQLTGYADDSSSCAAKNSEYNRIGLTENKCTVGSDGCEYLYPCGLVSNSFFNDTFELVTKSSSDSCTCGSASSSDIPEDFDCSGCAVWPTTSVDLSTDNIAWSSDDNFFKAYDNYNSDADTSYLSETYSSSIIQSSAAYEYGLEDPRYQVWMRPAAFSDFKKVYAQIETDIPANTEVTFTITSRFPAFFYEGTKHIVLATQNWQGPSKSYIMPWLFMGFGIYAITIAFLIALKLHLCPRPPGTDAYVDVVAESSDFVPNKNDWAIKSVVTGMITSAVSGRRQTEANEAGASLNGSESAKEGGEVDEDDEAEDPEGL